MPLGRRGVRLVENNGGFSDPLIHNLPLFSQVSPPMTSVSGGHQSKSINVLGKLPGLNFLKEKLVIIEIAML